jgi:hypothetical protein
MRASRLFQHYVIDHCVVLLLYLTCKSRQVTEKFPRVPDLCFVHSICEDFSTIDNTLYHLVQAIFSKSFISIFLARCSCNSFRLSTRT